MKVETTVQVGHLVQLDHQHLLVARVQTLHTVAHLEVHHHHHQRVLLLLAVEAAADHHLAAVAAAEALVDVDNLLILIR